MRPSLIVKFLLFFILISHVQGIRLNKGFLSHEDHKIQKGSIARNFDKEANMVAVERKDEHISGDTRKFTTKATSNPFTTSTSSTSKNNGRRPSGSQKAASSGCKGKGKGKSLSIDSTLGSEHRDTTAEQYPDVIDLTGMDYSPAKRKPPIHN